MASNKATFAQLSSPTKAGVLAAIVIVIGAVFYFALYMGVAEELEATQQQHNQLEQELAEARKLQQQYLSLRQELTQRREEDMRNLRVLPTDAEIASFLHDLHRLAELSDLEIRLVEPEAEEVEERYIRIPVTLKLSGTYHNVMKFFYNAGQVERAINMENIRLTQPTQRDGELHLKVDVSATTFRRAEDTMPAATPQAPS